MRLLLALFILSFFGGKESPENDTIQRNNTNFRAQVKQYAQNLGLPTPDITLNHSPEKEQKEGQILVEVLIEGDKVVGWTIEVDSQFLLRSSALKLSYMAAFYSCSMQVELADEKPETPFATILHCTCEQMGMKDYTHYKFELESKRTEGKRRTLDEIVEQHRTMWGDLPYR